MEQNLQRKVVFKSTISQRFLLHLFAEVNPTSRLLSKGKAKAKASMGVDAKSKKLSFGTMG